MIAPQESPGTIEDPQATTAPSGGIPIRALVISVAALGVPLAGLIISPEDEPGLGSLPWILALIPAFLLSWFRGWRSVSVALAIGMAGLSLAVTTGYLIGREIADWPLFLLVIAPYIALSLGVGWYSDVARERRQKAELTREADERLRRFAEASFDAIAVHDQGTLLDANPTFMSLFGYDQSDIPGLEVMHVIAPESRDLVMEMMQGGIETPFETVCLRKDGSTFPAEIRGRQLPYDRHFVTVAAVRDITQRRESEATLRQLEKALGTMQLGVTITDAHGRIIYVNQADARNHGYTVDELIGQKGSVFAHPGMRRQLGEGQLRMLSSWQRESVNLRKDGTAFPVVLRSDVIQSTDGNVLGVVTTCEDITERKATEAELESAAGRLRKSHADVKLFQEALIEAEKMESIGRLAAGVAHEVKNPLMTLVIGVKYLSRHADTADEKVKVLLADMHDAITRADTVIRGLLDFAAPRKLEMAPNDLNGIVIRTVDMMKHEINRGQISAVTELAADLQPMTLDPFKLQQVLLNLITNAVHATPPGGQITVRTFAHARAAVGAIGNDDNEGPRQEIDFPSVFVEIDDTGSGIPSEALSKIFEPFFTTKPTGKGTGLGLSVSRQIVQMHGGDLYIRNRRGGGARATVVFKLFNEA